MAKAIKKDIVTHDVVQIGMTYHIRRTVRSPDNTETSTTIWQGAVKETAELVLLHYRSKEKFVT